MRLFPQLHRLAITALPLAFQLIATAARILRPRSLGSAVADRLRFLSAHGAASADEFAGRDRRYRRQQPRRDRAVAMAADDHRPACRKARQGRRRGRRLRHRFCRARPDLAEDAAAAVGAQRRRRAKTWSSPIAARRRSGWCRSRPRPPRERIWEAPDAFSTGSNATSFRAMRSVRRGKSTPPSRPSGAYRTDLSRRLPLDLSGRASSTLGRAGRQSHGGGAGGSLRHLAARQMRMPSLLSGAKIRV
jgi:hypothetical protein